MLQNRRWRSDRPKKEISLLDAKTQSRLLPAVVLAFRSDELRTKAIKQYRDLSRGASRYSCAISARISITATGLAS
jgi:hypothetical protein